MTAKGDFRIMKKHVWKRKEGTEYMAENELIQFLTNQFHQMNQKFENMDKKFDQIDDKFQQMDNRFNQIDDKFQQIDSQLEQMNERFHQIDQRFEQVDEQFKQAEKQFQEVFHRFDRMESAQEKDISSVLRVIDKKMDHITFDIDYLRNRSSVHDMEIERLKNQLG